MQPEFFVKCASTSGDKECARGSYLLLGAAWNCTHIGDLMNLPNQWISDDAVKPFESISNLPALTVLNLPSVYGNKHKKPVKIYSVQGNLAKFFHVHINFLVTEWEGCKGTLARGRCSTDGARWDPYENDRWGPYENERGPIFPQ